MPDEAYVYLGDSARVPYGTKSAETVCLFAGQCARFLLEQEVKLIVVACNTASAVALAAIRAAVDVPVVGMIEPAAAAALDATSSGQIGVIGTRATVASNAYTTAIQRLNGHEPAPVVHSCACPLFVPMVEEGWIDHPATRLVAQDYLTPLFPPGGRIDTLVLGCTHYPLLKPLLYDLLPGIQLIDCGEHAAVVAQALLAQDDAFTASSEPWAEKPAVRFCLTDVPPAFVGIAERFLGFSVDHVERVSIDHL
jgi:glutamate racemase